MTFLQAMHDPLTGMIVGLIALGIMLALYMLPTIIAAKRGHHQTATIAVVNILLGWTLIGWVAALAWSVSAIRPAAA